MEATQASNGSIIKLDGNYLKVVKSSHTHSGRGKATVEITFRNVITGQPAKKTFKSDEDLNEIEVEYEKISFLYAKGDTLIFLDNKNKQLSLEDNTDVKLFLKKGMEVSGLFIEEKLLAVELPIKVTYVVSDAPPGLRGNTAGTATKTITIESGALIKTPLFINTGDKIVVNTQTGEYSERAK